VTGLGIDGGGSATRWALCNGAGAPLAAGEVPAASGLLFDAGARARLDAAAAALGAALAGLPAPDAVVAGITGLSAGSPEAEFAAAAIAEALGLPAARVRVREDTWIAYHGAFARGEGHMVYAGTGSVGLHVRVDGSTVRVGGRGMLIDDAGSAFWIGREALSMVWRRRDADPNWTSTLARALDAAIGDAGWEATRERVYGGGRGAVALLARAVAGADDADARALFTRAGAELARLAQVLVARAGRKPVALVGRAAALHPLILSAMRAAAPRLEISRRELDAALAAARLALRADG
jgi:N-acetylglucosamine kinase-like BadF-type ATPase